MKRIFMVGYSANKGGVETYIDSLASALDRGRYEIVYSLPEMEIDGKIWRRPPNRHDYLRYRLFWRRFFRENKFDVLYYNTCDVVSIEMLRFAKSARIPVRIIHSHSTGNQQALDKPLNLFHRVSERHNRRVLDRYATHFLACSQEAGEWLFDKRSFTVVKNGIHLSKFRYSEENRQKIRQKSGINNETLVGILGRISTPKNPSFAIQILKSLIGRSPDSRAVFLGDGDLRAQTEEAAARAGIQDRVKFMGNVNNANEWLSAFDVLLTPSLFEGAPFALIEAQANGLPCVVSSRISRDVDQTGLISFVDLEESPDVWASELLRAQGRRDPESVEKLTAAGYDAKTTAKTVAAIIEEGAPCR